MNTESPLVSVVLPVQNGEEYLKVAIQSILDQTYKNFELLILISAGSNEESRAIIKSFTDNRIKLIYRTPEENLPLALNRGIKESAGKYIARMDADDISLPNRFEEQVYYMEKNPNVGIAGSWVKIFGKGKSFVSKGLTDPEELRANLLFNTSLIHPSVIFRKEFLEKFKLEYNGANTHGEDYDMWARCSTHFQITNIPKVLLSYRIHSESKFQMHKKETQDVTSEAKMELLKKLGLNPNMGDLLTHISISPQDNEDPEEFFKKVESWLNKILEVNKKTKIYREKALEKVIYLRWYSICRANTKEGLITSHTYFKSNLWHYRKMLQLLDLVKIFILSILRK